MLGCEVDATKLKFGCDEFQSLDAMLM